jgi:membrane protease subunit HflK
MAWNEPGGNGDKDPWGNRGKNQSPPDLDEVLRNIQKKFGTLFGGKGPRSTGGGGSGGSIGGLSFGLVIGVVLCLWLASGFYKIESAERGIVMLFGKHVSTADPGLGWHIPYPIENVIKVDITKVFTIPLRATMLTQDENIIDIEGDIQYQIVDPVKYLFSVRSPELTLSQAAESALRQSIGSSKMDYVITEGRGEIAERVKKLTQSIMDSYHSGLVVNKVNIKAAKPPDEVKDAFDDVTQSREDQIRLRNEAEAYSNEVIPKARGAAARKRAEADGYQQEVIARAQGEARRFTELLKAYKKSPKVTRERMYLDMMESVLNKSSKVMVDVKGSNNLLYLPLDKLMSQVTDESNSKKNIGLTDIQKKDALRRAKQDIQNSDTTRTRGAQ